MMPPAALCAIRYHASRTRESMLQMSVRLGRLAGTLPHFGDAATSLDDTSHTPLDVVLELSIALDGHVLDGPTISAYAEAGPAGAVWGAGDEFESIGFSVKVRTFQSLCVNPLDMTTRTRLDETDQG